MFYLSDSLSILAFLVLLMFLVDCRGILCAVGGCVGVKNPYVQKCTLPCIPWHEHLHKLHPLCWLSVLT